MPSLWHRLKDFAKSEMTRIPLEKTLDVSLEAHTTFAELTMTVRLLCQVVQVRIYGLMSRNELTSVLQAHLLYCEWK